MSITHYLMIDNWKQAVDNNKVFGAFFTDLTKAFDCICHDLIVAKLNAYGLYLPALKMIQDYLQNQKQRTKIGSSYSSWEDITSGVPPGSILGPLLFNILLCDLFHGCQNNYFANYADETPPLTLLVTILQKYWQVCLVLLKSYLHGLLSIKSKQIMINAIYFCVLKRVLTFK